MKQFQEAGATLLGMSVDTTFSLNVWSLAMGGIRHPLLSDFWPHGAVAQSFGIFADGPGMVQRTLIIIDPDGVIRHSEAHTSTLPDPADALAKLAELKG